MLLDFRLYYETTVIKTVWHGHKNRHMGQCGQKARNKPTHLWAIIYNKGGKNIQWRKDSLFNKWCWGNGQLHVKEYIYKIFSHHIQKHKLKMD